MAMGGFESYRAAIVEEAVRVTKAISAELKTSAGMEVWRNYLFDLPGPRVLPRNLSPSEALFRTLFYGFNEIARTYESLGDFEVYVRRFPYRGSRISNPRHLSHTVEAYLNEVYILHQRLLIYLRRVRRYAEKRAIGAEAKRVLEPTEHLIQTAFGGIVRTRGAHVHQMRFEDDDVGRLNTLDLLVNHGHVAELRRFYNSEADRIRRKWHTTIRNNNREIKRLLHIYFSALRPFVFGPKMRLIVKRSV